MKNEKLAIIKFFKEIFLMNADIIHIINLIYLHFLYNLIIILDLKQMIQLAITLNSFLINS